MTTTNTIIEAREVGDAIGDLEVLREKLADLMEAAPFRGLCGGNLAKVIKSLDSTLSDWRKEEANPTY